MRRSPTLRNVPVEVSEETMDSLTGRGSDQERFRLYRLCLCETCAGRGYQTAMGTDAPLSTRTRCDDCRGEGRSLELIATAADEGGVGVAICNLGREGELDDCPIGVLEDGGSWIVKPWLPSPRNVSDAARLMATARKGEQ